MQYFGLQTIQDSIGALEEVSAGWLIPAFVFAANNVGTVDLVDMSKKRGTDRFLDRYFNASLIGIAKFPTGNNLLRPRMKGVKWQTGEFAGDYVIRQDTKMWGNLFSSRGYREMRQRGELEGEKATVRLTNSFQPAFESHVPESFEFEDFLVWLYAFSGFPDSVDSWESLFDHLLNDALFLDSFDDPYQGRFKLTPERAWPATLNYRPDNDMFLAELAPRLKAFLEQSETDPSTAGPSSKEFISADDPILATVRSAISKDTSRSFLLAGPPGTGKTHHAHDIADFLTEGNDGRVLFLQFHPAFGYDDFVEGFRPKIVAGKEVGNEHASTAGGVTYTLDRRHFLQFADKARQDPDELYVLVIDELNRGDVVRIFGELLTYLEQGYRDKEFTLAISGSVTSLPDNLVVLATANPFDRSVTDLDDALLRRFTVIMMEPDKALLESHLKEHGVEQRVLTRTLRLFEILKDAFPAGFGHTSFLDVRTIEDLDDVWTGRVQLGLQRALFHDRQRFTDLREEIERLLKIDEEAEASGEDDEEL